jgi:quinolinate synthase
MKRENPGKEFFPPMKPKICANMKKTGLIDVHNALQYEQYEIKIDESISKKAVKALNEMLKYI